MSVSEYQQFLNDHGYGPLAVDGVNGPKTKAAVKRWQADHGLAADGIVGPKTLASFQGGGGTTAAPAPAATGEQNFRDKYPQFSWAFSDPEVAGVLQQAVANKWGADEVQGAIQNTNWWKSKTDAERNWLQLLSTDPAEATRRLNNYDGITKYMSYANSFGIPTDFETAARQYDRVVRGEIAPDALTQELRYQAKAMYPQLAQQIDAGATIEDIYAPYKQMAASLLGVNPADIKLTDPKWQAPLQFTDKGVRRLATTDEWLRQLKTDPRFGYDNSTNGRTEAAQFATSLGREFGVIG